MDGSYISALHEAARRAAVLKRDYDIWQTPSGEFFIRPVDDPCKTGRGYKHVKTVTQSHPLTALHRATQAALDRGEKSIEEERK